MFDDGRSMAFDSAGKLTAILDRSGNATTFAYDTENRMISSTDPLGRIAEYVYRTDGQLSSVFARGQTISFVYHDGTGPGGMDGDLLSIRIGDGSEQDKTMLFTYPEVIPSNPLLSHNILTLTDSLGNTYVRNVYDEHDRVISQQYGDSTAQYEYAVADIYADGTTEPAIGQYVVQNRVTNGRGTVTEYTYDRIGNMLSRRVYASDGSGDSTETAYGYSEEGYLISETSTLGSGKKFAYDSRGNRTETRLKNDMAVPDGDDDIVERREYDPVNDRLLRRIAPDANVTDYSYDEFGRLTSVTKKSVRLDSDSEETSNLADTYEYDELGRLIRSMDAGGIETTVSYE